MKVDVMFIFQIDFHINYDVYVLSKKLNLKYDSSRRTQIF